MEVYIMEESCKQLWFAVLKQAIKDAQEHYSMYGENAQSWFNSNNQETTSFLWICSMLDIDPALIRMRLTTSRASYVDKIAV